MKRASYREAIAHIALNDNPGDPDSQDSETISGYLTVGLVADLFGVPTFRVARDVINYRCVKALRDKKEEQS